MKLREVISVIEEFAPLSIQEKWDNSGIQIGSPDQEVHSALIALDCTEKLIEEAAQKGCDLVITHHPLLFGGVRRISGEDPTGSAILAAARHGIAVYAAHTTSDKVIGGVSWAMAEKLGLKDVRILETDGHLPSGDAPAGLGAIGELPHEMEAREFIGFVKKAFGLSCIRTSAPVQVPIRTVAVCGGSGASLMEKAMEEGAQVFLTADLSYHRFFTPAGFMVADMGHFESEVAIVDIFFSLLRKKIPNFASLISESITNPINYL